MPVRGRPGHHARGDGRPRRRPDQDQPARAGRAGHRPLRDRRRVRHVCGASPATSRSSTSATASATSSCGGARARSTTSRSCRPAPASCTRSTSSTSPAWSSPGTATATTVAYPDTCVGTDSHTTMVNGLGVVGWGVGGIEAEAAMLGQPVSMLIPRVVGFKLSGELPEGATATDLVLTITEMLRKHGVVGKFVEFYGSGVCRRAAGQPRHHRQHVAGVRLDDRGLPDRRRDAPLPAAHRARRGADRAGRGVRQGAGALARPRRRAALLRAPRARPRRPSSRRSPGPKRPQDRISLTDAKAGFRARARRLRRRRRGRREGVRRGAAESFPASDPPSYRGDNGSAPPRELGRAAATRAAAPSNPVHGHARATARSSSSTTARSPSRRSRRAPTRRTRR